jgi:hypothetical protein
MSTPEKLDGAILEGMNNKTLVYVVAGVVVLAVVVWLVNRGVVKAPYLPGATPTASPRANATPTPTPTGTAIKTPTPAPTNPPQSQQSYNDAVAAYANLRMQFDSSCQASPTRLSISHGTSIMLDNRSSSVRVISVGGVSFTLPGYGWKIMMPTAATYPSTLNVDCGSARNVATVVVQ